MAFVNTVPVFASSSKVAVDAQTCFLNTKNSRKVGSFKAASTKFEAAAAPAVFSVSASAERVAEKATTFGRALAAFVAAAGISFAGVSQANAEGLTFDQLNSANYLKLKGTGISNTCPTLGASARGNISLEKGKEYYLTDLCIQPTEILVKAESLQKGKGEEFQPTRLVTRATYTIDKVEGPIFVDSDNQVTFVEKDGFDYQALTVKLPGGELVPMLFTVKELIAKAPVSDGGISPATNLKGSFAVPSYRMGNFLDPKGRGLATGYDFAHALPAADQEELAKENDKQNITREGQISLQVVRVDGATGEIAGVWESSQPGDDDLGSKNPKPVKLSGVWYARVNDSNPAL
uniref:Oxygen-evolving enhancer protein 1 n=1 Tax=Cyanophora paradoxa TaxID=2762 RepID=Q5CC91_CYAPA|nr:oxygen-evolving enhancer protein 1 [Cyanophora paradoxa]